MCDEGNMLRTYVAFAYTRRMFPSSYNVCCVRAVYVLCSGSLKGRCGTIVVIERGHCVLCHLPSGGLTIKHHICIAQRTHINRKGWLSPEICGRGGVARSQTGKGAVHACAASRALAACHNVAPAPRGGVPRRACRCLPGDARLTSCAMAGSLPSAHRFLDRTKNGCLIYWRPTRMVSPWFRILYK